MAQPKRVGYAVIGLGHIAERAVLPAFRHAKKSRLVALSSDPAKARRLARKFRAPQFFTYDRFEECLGNPEVEAVYMATNNSSTLFSLAARLKPGSTSSARNRSPIHPKSAGKWSRRAAEARSG